MKFFFMYMTLSLLLFSNTLANTNETIILIKGYNNEKIDSYYKEHESLLKMWSFKKVMVISPPSEKNIFENSKMITEKLSKIKGNFKVIAHSKGGVEALVSILNSPKLINKISSMLLVQSPLRGSPFADHYWKKQDRENFLTPGYLYYSRLMYSGFLSMRTSETEEVLRKSSKNISVEQIKKLSAKLFYWRSRKLTPSEGYKDFKEALIGYPDNDGLVPSSHMKLDSIKGISPFGVDLGIKEDIEHLEVVSSPDTNNGPRKLKIKNFLKSILQL
jgi:predicted alpha/beta hydrolase family esterase